MMNLSRRIRISSLVFRIYRAGTSHWLLIASLLTLPVNAVATLAKWTTRRRLAKYTNAVNKYRQRTEAILPKLRVLDRLAEPRKTQVLAARAALLEESKHLKAFAAQFASHRAPGLTLLMPTLIYVRKKLGRQKRKADSFTIIIDRIDSDTFYYDLLLWILVPVAYGEELLGDLNEEYSLRHSSYGLASAKAWYRAQVARTLGDCFWNKIERLAAFGTLIDLVDQWFRK